MTGGLLLHCRHSIVGLHGEAQHGYSLKWGVCMWVRMSWDHLKHPDVSVDNTEQLAPPDVAHTWESYQALGCQSQPPGSANKEDISGLPLGISVRLVCRTWAHSWAQACSSSSAFSVMKGFGLQLQGLRKLGYPQPLGEQADSSYVPRISGYLARSLPLWSSHVHEAKRVEAKTYLQISRTKILWCLLLRLSSCLSLWKFNGFT